MSDYYGDDIRYKRPSRRTAEPAVEPVSLAEAKSHLRISHDDEDGLLTAYIAAARQMVEEHLRISIITSAWRQVRNAFPLGDGFIQINRAPVISVTSITYTDAGGSTQTLSASDYVVSTEDKPARIWLAYSKTWPDVRDIREAVQVNFSAGYGTNTAAVPGAIKTALLTIVGGLYESREANIVGMSVDDNPLVNALLAPYQWDIR